jgi:hypothetical protein
MNVDEKVRLRYSGHVTPSTILCRIFKVPIAVVRDSSERQLVGDIIPSAPPIYIIIRFQSYILLCYFSLSDGHRYTVLTKSNPCWEAHFSRRVQRVFATRMSRIWSAHHVYNICVGCARDAAPAECDTRVGCALPTRLSRVSSIHVLQMSRTSSA